MELFGEQSIDTSRIGTAEKIWSIDPCRVPMVVRYNDMGDLEVDSQDEAYCAAWTNVKESEVQEKILAHLRDAAQRKVNEGIRMLKELELY